VRVAIGALPRQIVSLIIREGMGLTLAGIGIGLAIALGVGRVLTSLLYEVRPIDPLTLAAVTVLFVVVGAAALIPPSWRAAHVDPVVALRQE
jgi:ABC-type antimicrobial peptide transport system permease subunit